MKIFLVTCCLVACAVLINFCNNSPAEQKPALVAAYVGTPECQSCHAKEFKSYTGSDHYHAMDTALPERVLGDFNNRYFVYYGDTTFFYRKGNRFVVRTTGESGIKKEYTISYTFGYKPLQQYLVQQDSGKIQVLPFCWDTRPREKGGQRWFHIYNHDKVLPGDELFWTGINQNWNYMCADCHTTDYQKNFDESTHSFHSTWKESRVFCESCHGPASLHIQWAAGKKSSTPYKGFAFSLAASNSNWVFDSSRGTLLPREVHINHAQIETCARCHARATRFTDRYQHGESFLQSHIPAVTGAGNYHIDGQIREEDYEYGSFLQSKMYAAGVTCSNCHDAHSMQLKMPGNAVCASCHSPAKFDVPAHTHHVVNSAGAQCVNCHMPATTYMVVDDRRDHSIRIPRPDLSLTMGTPNACNKCHTNKSVQWAAGNFLKWYKEKLLANVIYGELMHTVSQHIKESEPALNTLLAANNYPAIIKATALEQFNQFSRPSTREQVMRFLKDEDPFLRLNALKAAAGYPAEILLPAASPLLTDAVKSVRMEAVLTLAPYTATLDAASLQQFNTVMQEYTDVQRNLSHRPEGYLNRGILFSLLGRTAEAAKLYMEGLRYFPENIQLYVNLADACRQMNQEQQSKIYIDKGLALQPANADLQYVLGLWYIRQKKYGEGMAALKKAAALQPANASLVYGYAVGLYSTGKKAEAIQLLENYTSRHGNNLAILNGLIPMCQETNNQEKANRYISLRNSVYGM